MKRYEFKKHKHGEWTLTPQQWEEVLDTKVNIQKNAQNIRQGKVTPWTQNLLSHTGLTEKILDLGSGTGENSAVLTLNGREMTLIDFSPENIESSKKLFDELCIDAEFIQADITRQLPFEDETFDTVFSCGMFEYFDNREIIVILREAFRVAKNQVIIMVPNAASIPYRVGCFYNKIFNQHEWEWERCFFSFKPFIKRLGIYETAEFSMATKYSLNFLNMPIGNILKKITLNLLKLRDDSAPSLLNQGYLLVSIAQKE